MLHHAPETCSVSQSLYERAVQASNVLRLTLLNKNDNIEVTCASRELAEQWMDAIEWSVRPHVASRFKYRFTKAMALLVNAVDNTDSLAPFRAALNLSLIHI